MEVYWELILKDGTRIDFPPALVPVVQKRMDAHDPIHTKNYGSIPYANIDYFRPTGKRYSDQKLLDEVSQVFNEPAINPDGSIVAKWVKKPVTISKWEKHYAPHGMYYKLAEEGGLVMIGFRLPVHLIDPNIVTLCSDTEVATLDKQLKTNS